MGILFTSLYVVSNCISAGSCLIASPVAPGVLYESFHRFIVIGQ